MLWLIWDCKSTSLFTFASHSAEKRVQTPTMGEQGREIESLSLFESPGAFHPVQQAWWCWVSPFLLLASTKG